MNLQLADTMYEKENNINLFPPTSFALTHISLGNKHWALLPVVEERERKRVREREREKENESVCM